MKKVEAKNSVRSYDLRVTSIIKGVIAGLTRNHLVKSVVGGRLRVKPAMTATVGTGRAASLLMLAIGMCVSVNAQSGGKTHKAIKHRLDSIVSPQKYKQTFSSYDNNGYGGLRISYDWDLDSENWIEKQKQELTCDSNNNLILDFKLVWNSGMWRTDSKSEFTYDSNNNLLLRIDSIVLGGVLRADNKSEYTYDSNNNLTSEISYVGNSGNWVESWNREFTYDNNNNRILEIDYGWYSGNWVEIYKYEFTYDTKNNQTSKTEYYWSSGNWVESWKQEFTYDNNNNLTSETNYYRNSGNWVGSYKQEFTYDNNNNRISETGYYWDSGNWIEDYKQEYTYNLSYSLADLIIPDKLSPFPINNMFTDWKSYTWSGTDWTENEVAIFYWDEIWVSVPPKITTTSLPNGVVNTYYKSTITVTEYSTIIGWEVDSGALPDGLSLYSNGEISGTPTTVGTFYFTIKVENTVGSDSKALSIKIEEELGIEQLTMNNEQLTIYPNPAGNQLHITRGHAPLWEGTEYVIYSVVGQAVMQAPLNPPSNGETSAANSPFKGGRGMSEIKIDVSHLASGMYFLKINNKTVKFVKQ